MTTSLEAAALEKLHEVGLALTSGLSLQDVLEVVVKGAQEVIGADIAALYPMIDGVFLPPVVAGEMLSSHELSPLPRPDGVAYRILEEGFVVVENLENEPEMGSRFTSTEGIRSFVGAASRVGGESVGVLYVDFRDLHPLTGDECNTIRLLATQAAIAILNARLFVASEQRISEIERLAEAGQRILTTQHDSGRVLQDIVDRAVDALEADLVILYLYRAARQEFEFPSICAGTLLEPEFPEKPVTDGNNVVFGILGSAAAHYAADAGTDRIMSGKPSPELLPAAQPFVVREGIASSAGIPLKVADEIVGVMFVNYRTPKAFSSHHRKMIETFANYAAIAIQNSRLFDKIRSALDRRIEELNALVAIDEAIMAGNLDAVLERIIDAACAIVGAPNGNILLVDETGEYVKLRAVHGTPWVKDVRTRFQIGRHGVTGYVAEHKRSVRIPDVHAEEWKDIYIPAPLDTQSELAVPLLDDKEALVGIINLESPRLATFSADDQRLLEALAAQATIAIQNHRSFEAEQRMRREFEVLSEIDHAISSTLDLDKVLNLIIEKGLTLVEAPYGNIMLLDRIRGDLWLAVGRGTIPGKERARQGMGEGVVGLAADQREAIVVSDVTEAPWKEVYVPFIEGIRSELAVPMVYNGTLVGVLNAESGEVGKFSSDDTRILEALASRAVIAIQNAELYAESEEARDRFETLFEVAKGLLNEPLGVTEVLSVPLLLGMGRVGVHAATAWLLDETGEYLEAVVSIGAAEDMELSPIALEQTCVNSWVARNRRTCLVSDVETPPNGIKYVRGHPDTQSELVVPLIVGGTYLGNLYFGHPEKGAFHEDEVRLIEGLAAQAASALKRIEREKQLSAARQRELESRQMADVGQTALELTHRIGNSLGGIKTFIDEIRDALGRDHAEVNARLEDILRDVQGVLAFSRKLREIAARSMEVSDKKSIPSELLLSNASEAYPVGAGVEVRVNCREDVPPVWVDERAFDVFVNLFTNAVQALPPEGGKIELGAKQVGEWVEFWVSDTGVGILEQDLDRIFQLFYSTKPEGLGFGLWSAKQAVMANGGHIWVASTAGQGSTFTVRLPRGALK